MINNTDFFFLYKTEYILNGKPLRQIATEYHMGDNTLIKKFGELDLPLKRPGQRTGNKISKLNNKAFDVWSKDMAYWLGFIAADGYVASNRNSLGVKLSAKDSDHLVKLLNFLGSEKQVITYAMKYQNGIADMSYISISDQYLYDKLISLGIKPNKTYLNTNYLEYIPEEYQDSFLIGYFDGDGTIGYVGKENFPFRIGYCALSSDFMKAVRDYFCAKHEFTEVAIVKSKKRKMSSVTWGSKGNVVVFARMYLELGNTTLNRKRSIIETINY